MRFPSLIGSILLGAGLAASGLAAQAADYPTRPIRLISPYAPGGVADPVSRALAEGMGQDLGQAVIVENKAGAGTMIGIGAIANAPPDGYSTVLVSNAMVTAPFLYKKMAYAPADVRTIAIIATAPLVITINPRIPAKNLREFAAYAKASGTPLTYASVGRGNVLHLLTELFAEETGARLQEVMYSGKSGEALMAVMKGEVDMMVTVAAQATPQVLAGKLRAIAVTTPARLDAMPEVPTVGEGGYPGLIGGTWYGIAVQARTPEPIVQRLRASIDRMLADPTFSTRFVSQGLIIEKPRTEAEVNDFVKADQARWKPLLERLQITAD